MSIEAFHKKYTGQERSIKEVAQDWESQDVEVVLNSISFGSVILADALQGDGLTDRISPQLLEALHQVYTHCTELT